MHRIRSYRNLLSFRIVLILLTSISVQAASFDYRHYESILNRYLKPDVSIEGIRVTVVDYTAVALEAEKQDSDCSALFRTLASFDPATLDTHDDKIAFWIKIYNIIDREKKTIYLSQYLNLTKSTLMSSPEG